jgi:predicted short-subunit dehydrogenase-like oxidoreductase (DUF2520 family)
MKGNGCPTCGHVADGDGLDVEDTADQASEMSPEQSNKDRILAELQEMLNGSMGDPLQDIVSLKNKKPEVV